MSGFLPLLIVAVALAVVMGFFTWLASVVRRRGVAGSGFRGAMASYDEAFHGTAHASHYEIRAQAERQAPILSPDQPWRPDRFRAGGTRPGEGGRRTARPRPRRGWRGLRRRAGGLGRGR